MFFFFHLEAHHLEAHHLEAHLSTNVSLHLEAHLSTNVSHNNANMSVHRGNLRFYVNVISHHDQQPTSMAAHFSLVVSLAYSTQYQDI
jgi:hypothetical protein